jgi:xanthine/uracil permease
MELFLDLVFDDCSTIAFCGLVGLILSWFQKNPKLSDDGLIIGVVLAIVFDVVLSQLSKYA